MKKAESGNLEVKDLHAGFAHTEVVKGISLSFPANTVSAIIGPSGCGKSTFLRCLNRMHEEVPQAFSAGTILLDGIDISSRKLRPQLLRQKIGMVFQKPNPFSNMSIYENVIVGLRLAGVRRAAILDEAVEESLKLAALWDEVRDKLHTQGTSLSGGQQQRLCIARALAIRPRVLLMDEPTSALDPISTAKIEELVNDLKKEVTIAMVTHNLQQAARVSSNTSFFLSGQLVESGPTSQIFTNPKDARTEQYITGRFG